MNTLIRKRIGFAVLLFLFAALLLTNKADAKQEVRLSQNDMILAAGKSKTLHLSGISETKQKNITWKSSDSKIVSVNRNGRVKAKKAGSATVTAKLGGKQYQCRILVLSKANGSYGKGAVTQGTEYYRDFSVDNVLHSENDGDIHYNVYFPDSYDGKSEYALYVTLPGYQGLYFQGVAENLKTEDFAFEAKKYHSKMIILAPQLGDWGETSADQTIALVEYFLSHYKIDPAKVYINGYSGGGETLSIVLGKRPELFTAALMCSSQWDGKYQPVVKARTPVYFVIGESDEYYGSAPFQNAYNKLYSLYEKEGLSEKEIEDLLVLDIKDSSYFEGTGIVYQHGGGYLFCRDRRIMNWLFQK